MTAVDMICDEMDTAFAPVDDRKLLSVVVATDGSGASDSVFVAATLIEAKTGCKVHVLSVLEPLPMIFPAQEAFGAPAPAPAGLDASRADILEGMVERQRRRVDPGSKWDITVRHGGVADSIARFARERDAGLVIVGASRHNFLDRMLGGETAMELSRLLHVPLLVASKEMRRLPRRVVVAMDIKPCGLEALPRALAVVADTKTISCVHVKPRAEFMGIDWADFDREYEAAMLDRFHTVEKMFTSAGLRADLMVRHGDVTRELAEYAEYAKAELVVVGINRRRGALKTSGGRLAGRMLRRLEGSILIVPGLSEAPIKADFPHGGRTDVFRKSTEWGSAMKAFSGRNAGRTCNLEVDDPELGALIEARSYPLLGVDYDRRDGRLTILLGDSAGTERHLARSVPAPDAISVLSVNGRDAALSVSHGKGQTLLTF